MFSYSPFILLRITAQATSIKKNVNMNSFVGPLSKKYKKL